MNSEDLKEALERAYITHELSFHQNFMNHWNKVQVWLEETFEMIDKQRGD